MFTLRISTIVTLFILLFSESLLPQADGTSILRGFVTDSTNGEAITYANVFIKGSTWGATTDTRGYFIIPALPPGKHTVIVSYIGYEKKEVFVSLTADKITQIEVQLFPTSVELEELSVIGEKSVRKNETDIGLEKITAAEMDLIPQGIETDILRTLQSVPGVKTTGDVSARYYVRGGGSDQNLVTLNGATVYNPYHALGIFSVIDPELVKVMEFYKGGFTAEYGGRLSSILSLTPKDGNKKRFQGSAAASFLTGKASLEGPIPNGSFILTGRKSTYTEVLKNYLDDQQAPFDFYDFSLRLNYNNPDMFENAKFVVHAFVSKDELNNDQPSEEDYLFNNAVYGVNWYQVWGSPLYSIMSFSISQFDAEVEPNLSNAKRRENRIHDFSMNWDFTYMFDSRDELGLGLQQKVFSSDLVTENLRGGVSELSENGISLVLYSKYKFMRWDDLGLDVGVRANLFTISDQRGSFIEPRASFTYSPSPLFTFKAAWGKYTQEITTLIDENDLVAIFEPWIIIPGYLPPSEATHYVVGIQSYFTEELSLEFEGYYKDIQNLTDVNPRKYTSQDPDFIAVSGKSYGVESLLKYQSSTLFMQASYALSWAEKERPTFTYSPRYDIRHSVGLQLGIHLWAGFQFSASWSYSTGMPFTPIRGYYDRLQINDFWNPWYLLDGYKTVTQWGDKNVSRLPEYHRLDLSLSKKIDFGLASAHLEVNLINVYDRKNMFYFDDETGERVNMLPFLPSASIKVEL